MAKAAKPIPEGYHTVTPHLVLDNTAEALEWYKKALGAAELSRSVGPDGKVMHAEIRIGDSRIMMNDAMGGGKAIGAFGGSPVSLWLFVEDCDSLFKRAVAAGGTVGMEMADQFWGDRCGSIIDPFGYSWSIATRKEDVTQQEMERRAQDFFKQFAGQQR